MEEYRERKFKYNQRVVVTHPQPCESGGCEPNNCPYYEKVAYIIGYGHGKNRPNSPGISFQKNWQPYTAGWCDGCPEDYIVDAKEYLAKHKDSINSKTFEF